MTAQETKTVQEVSKTQAVMKEHQKNMQGDIDELKLITKEVNKKLDGLTSTLDNLTGGKQALMWFTGTVLVICGLVISFLHKR